MTTIEFLEVINDFKNEHQDLSVDLDTALDTAIDLGNNLQYETYVSIMERLYEDFGVEDVG